MPIEEREEILTSYKETELHSHIKELLGRMDSNSYIEITHGSEEHGNDIVMIKQDVFRTSVIGIIVKSGDIKGQTKGKVDEIKSQIEQSLAHPVRLKAIPDKVLYISEVWVMIAGIISKNAHERLEEEVMAKGEHIRFDFGLDWLVKNFTWYYPQVFFEGRLMDFLVEKILQLEASVPLFCQRGKNLSECFVEPMFCKIDVPENFDEETFLIKIEEQRFFFGQLNNLIKPRSKILLFGDPGVGKTVVLNKYVLDRLQEAWASAIRKELPEQMEIPIKISANEFLKINSHEDLIQQYIGSYIEIHNRLKVKIILIDGLDEVLSNQRDELIEKAIKFSDDLKCCLLISTRKTDLIKKPPVGFERYELLPFNYNQALELYNKLKLDSQILDALRVGLESISYQVPMTPLSLYLLLKIVEARKEVPASITELYDQFSDIALGQYDYEKGMMILFEYQIKKRFLAELAYKEFLEKERSDMPEDEFASFLKNYADLYGWNAEILKGFTDEIERAGILNLKQKAVSFSHGSFMEYFGAFYIWDNREKFKDLEDFIVRSYFEDFWSGVAFFYIGLQKKIDLSMLNKLFAYPGEGFGIHGQKFLIGRLLQAGWHSTADTRYKGIQKALTYAPVVRQEFSSILEKNRKIYPAILSDFFVMFLSDISFGSRILVDKGKELLDALANQPLYLFNWDKIPGNDSILLMEFLKQNFGIDWIKTAKIEKIDADKTIRLYTEKNSLSLRLNDEKTKVNIKIDDERTDEFIARTENGELNIYQPSYQNAYMMLSLLWAFQRLMPEENVHNSINSILKVLSEIPRHSIEEKAKMFSLIMLIEQKDQDFGRLLRRRLIRVTKRDPDVFKRLLGSPKKKGFRKNKRNQTLPKPRI